MLEREVLGLRIRDDFYHFDVSVLGREVLGIVGQGLRVRHHLEYLPLEPFPSC